MALSKITYANKSALNPQPSIADENKVTDANMNEIKSVVNNAIDQVDANTTNIGDITGTILWTNSSPTSSFGSQEIPLPTNSCDVIEIFYYTDTSTRQISSLKVPIGETANLITMFQKDDHGQMGSRPVVYNNSSKVTVYDTTTIVVNDAFNRTGNNGWCIPLYLVGYKTGLFS